ncbi:M10 family metallopeptidase C-terminal domain-containing protein [Gammaproteobacteria bacterium]|nr:M10 family metallopeptidase C-terminal domain-containing protein [Gammaproteobacteria bacterium]
MSSNPYPYWLSSLIGTQETAGGYSKLVEGSKMFFYIFPESVPVYSAATEMAEGFTPFNDIQKQNAMDALKYIETVTALLFVQTNEVLESNTLVFAFNTQEEDSYAYAYLPEIHPLGSDIYMAIHPTNETMSVGTEGALTLIHEIGHALGLKHPHEEAEGSGEVSVLPADEDSVANTVMSYEESTVENFKFEFNTLDIAALHYIYGPNPKARASDDTYEISSTQTNFIWDGAGVDTIDASKLEAGVTLHLSPGYHDFVGESAASIVTAPGQITVNFGTTIENVIGSVFNDALFGNAQANVITDNGGSDNIDGGDGTDIAIYSESLSAITLSSNKENTNVIWEITQANGKKDTLVNVERLSFNDTRVALDLDGNAGRTAKLLGAFLGSAGVSNKSLVGIGLQYLDSGGTYESLTELAISTVFGETPNSRSVVATFYKNLTGQQAPESVIDTYASLLDDGDLSLLSLSLQVADNEINLSNINFVGLSSTGIEYS